MKKFLLMIKNTIFIFLGLFSLLGTIAMLNISIAGSIFYLSLFIICLFIEKRVIKSIFVKVYKLLKTDICPICENEIKCYKKSGLKFKEHYICMKCCSKLTPYKINLFNIKNYSLEELNKFIDIHNQKLKNKCNNCKPDTNNIKIDNNSKTKYNYAKLSKKDIITMIDEKILPSLKRDAKLRNSLKRNLVKVTTHGDSCPLCKRYEGKILNDDLFTFFKPDKKYGLLSDAIKEGLFHKGCRHGLTTYYPELEGVKYDKDETNDLNYKGISISIKSHNVTYSNPYKNAVPSHIYSNSYVERKQNRITKDYVVFDTETTGLEPEIDKIIEISAIKYKDGKKIETFSQLVNPKQKLDPFITQLTGIKQTELISKPTIDKVLPKFFEFIENYTLVAHNAPFDIKMLACESYRNNITMCDNKVIDTVALIKRVLPKSEITDYKLTTLKSYLGLNFSSHRALDDCETCARVYQLYLEKSLKLLKYNIKQAYFEKDLIDILKKFNNQNGTNFSFDKEHDILFDVDTGEIL